MKTKEIEVWVSPNVFERYESGKCCMTGYKDQYEGSVKAKLIIEIPEKKIEISESDFEQAVMETDEFYRANTGNKRWVDKFKQTLFGGKS